MKTWWLEFVIGKKGWPFSGTFVEALREAQANCTTDCTQVDVWDAENLQAARVGFRGVEWVHRRWEDQRYGS